ncbi:MAG: hypothetical protein M1829_006315 [Trizodia sp. TS-e1964]|nr:MAG: hypothetical protein M1829_006315 [Trizodia sp. TS-e1964]
MYSPSNERWLWAGFGVLSFGLILSASRLLSSSQDSQPIPPQPNSAFNQAAEDSIKVDTLQKLAEGSNYDLRIAALKIVCDRATSGPTYNALLIQASQGKPEALSALRFLFGSPTGSRLYNFRTYKALISAMILFSPKEPAPAGAPHQRISDARTAMFLLSRLLPPHIPEALRAGVVTRWLASYPFASSPEETVKVVQSYLSFSIDDLHMCDILRAIHLSPEGRKQMREAGLLDPETLEAKDENAEAVDENNPATFMINGRRPRDESVEEQQLRRRRREAMVLSDGLLPLGREDIIQRGDEDEGELDHEIDRELEQMYQDARTAEKEISWSPWLLVQCLALAISWQGIRNVLSI